MRPREHRLWSLLVLLGCSGACGEAPLAPAPAGTAGVAGRPSNDEAGAGGADETLPGAGGGDNTAGGSEAVVEIVDVPAAEHCTPTAAMPNVFMPPEEFGLVFEFPVARAWHAFRRLHRGRHRRPSGRS